jgi:REP element-mobilizing transposase RayT
MAKKQESRRSIRLLDYDYTTPGAYFVTIGTQNRGCLFGEILDGQLRLNELGRIVSEEWLRTAAIRLSIAIDEFIVMPNHFHGLLLINCRGTARRGEVRETCLWFFTNDNQIV